MDAQKVEAALEEAKKVSEIADSSNGKTNLSDTNLTTIVAEDGSKEEERVSKGAKRKSDETDDDAEGEKVQFKVIFNKKKYDVSFPLDSNVSALKSHLQPMIGIPPAMMKVMIKGLAKDELTLRQLAVVKGTKVMVIGSSLEQVLTVTKAPTSKDQKEDEAKSSGASSSSSSSSKEKMHKKVLDKGKPDDVMPARKDSKEPLPSTPLTGMLNKYGGKVRLTFKMHQDQLWISTKERTEKVDMGSIKNVLSEPIEGHPEYHIVALQLGTTQASSYYVYWVPSQYVDAIKDAVLGKWASW